MQIRSKRLSELKRMLIQSSHASADDLAPFLSDHSLIKGTVYPLRRKCSKPSCRCARGERHETIVLTENIGGKTRLWMIPEERIEEIRQETALYREFRRARRRFLKECGRRQKEMLLLIDEIGKNRTRRP